MRKKKKVHFVTAVPLKAANSITLSFCLQSCLPLFLTWTAPCKMATESTKPEKEDSRRCSWAPQVLQVCISKNQLYIILHVGKPKIRLDDTGASRLYWGYM